MHMEDTQGTLFLWFVGYQELKEGYEQLKEPIVVSKPDSVATHNVSWVIPFLLVPNVAILKINGHHRLDIFMDVAR